MRDPQPWQIADIRKHWKSNDIEWRMTALFAMGQMPGFEKELHDAVQETSGALLVEAVHSAGSQGVREAAGRIRELATSARADLDLRLAAIDALPHVDHDSYDVLQRLRRSRNRNLAEAARAALDELRMREESASYPEDEEEDDGRE